MDKNRKITINFNNYEPKTSREEKNRITEKEFNKEKKRKIENLYIILIEIKQNIIILELG